MDPFTIISAVGALAPSVMRWLGHPNAAKVADQAVKSVQAITGQSDLDTGLAALKANPEQLVKFQDSMNQLAIAQLDAETKQLQAVNDTMKEEIASGDPWVRRARPTWLYVMCATWALQGLAVAWVIAFKTEDAAKAIDALGGLTAAWSVALAVVGVYVKSRSDDKKTAAGKEAPSMVAALAGLLAKKKAA